MATMTKKSMGVDGSSLSSRKDKGKATMVEETQKAVNNNGNVNVEKLTLGSPATGNVKSLSNKVDGKGLELEESLKKLTLESSEIKEEKEVVEKKFLTLKTSDGETFKVEEDVILQSETIKILVEDGCGGDEIPLVNVTGNILTMVIEYCKHHVGDKKYGKEAEEPTDWNDKFIDVDQKTVFNIILAANYLNIKGLLDLSCEKAAKMISGKPVPEIRRILGIKNHGFTEEEEEENRKWSPWAYED